MAELHSVWDALLIAKAILNTPQNYTDALPSKYIEDALFGKAYDPYVRQIMYEGILGKYKPDLDAWLACPAVDAPSRLYPPTELLNQLPLTPSSPRNRFSLSEFFYSLLTPKTKTTPTTKSLAKDEDVPPTDDSFVCPYAWAKPMHQLNCEIIWPLELDDPEREGYLELDTPEYSGKIREEWVLERQLAMGGIRLAAILNYLFAGDEAPLYRG